MPILLLALTLFALQDDTAALIEKLRSENPEVRDAATKRLKELGAAAKPALEKASNDGDAEVAKRAAYLLRILQLKDELSPNLQKLIPDIAEKLATPGDANWTEVFMEATKTDQQEELKFSTVSRDDLIPLAARAVRGASSTPDKQRVCQVAAHWRLQAAIPEMEKLLKDDCRAVAAIWLGQLGGRAVAPKIAELLKDPEPYVRRMAAMTLQEIGSKAQVPSLIAALRDSDANVQWAAVDALGRIGDKSAVPSLVGMLETPVRRFAAKALASLGSYEHVDLIAGILKEEKGRTEAMGALWMLDARDRAELIAPFLDDPSSSVNGYAAFVLGGWKIRKYSDRIAALVLADKDGGSSLAIIGLGRLGDPAHAKALTPILNNPNAPTRAEAAGSLALLDARDRLPDMSALLKDPEIYARWQGTLALGRLASRLPEGDRKPWIEAIRPLERDPSGDVRFAASISLLRLGALTAEQTRELLKRLDGGWSSYRWYMIGEVGLALLQLHEKDGYEKLMRESEVKRLIDSPESLSAALADRGLKLADWEGLILKGRMGVGRTIHLWDLLSIMIEGRPGVIIEKDSIRLVGREEAFEHWLKRLKK